MYEEFKMRVIKHVMDTFNKHNGMKTCIYTVTDKNNYKIIPAPKEPFHKNAPQDAKDKLAEIFRSMLSDINAQMCCFVSEAWMYKGKTDEDKEKIEKQGYEKWKKNKDKQEILNLIFEFRNNIKENGYFMCFRIERDDKNKPILNINK